MRIYTQRIHYDSRPTVIIQELTTSRLIANLIDMETKNGIEVEEEKQELCPSIRSAKPSIDRRLL